jgi:hypothetical protein
MILLFYIMFFAITVFDLILLQFETTQSLTAEIAKKDGEDCG